MPFSTSIAVTNAGLQLLDNYVSGSGAFTLTKVTAGDGIAGTDDVTLYTHLKHEVVTATTTSFNNEVARQCTVRFVIDSANVSTLFQANEFGVWAGSTLFAYACSTALDGDWITPAAAPANVVRDYALLIKFSSLTPVACTVTLQPQVQLHASTHLDNGIDPVAVATTTRTGLMWKLSGLVTQYAAGNGTWQNVIPFIMVPTTLYVATTGNDSTALPNDASHPWLTLQGACNWLLNYQIFTGVPVTISLGAGTFSSSVPITFLHPQGSQITLTGQALVATTSTSVGSISGSAGAYSLVFNVASTTGLSIGDYLTILGAAGPHLDGCWKISAIAGSTITVTFTCLYAGVVVGSGMNGAAIWTYPSKCVFSANTTGFILGSPGLGHVNNLQITTSFAFNSGNAMQGATPPVNVAFANVSINGWNGASAGIYFSGSGAGFTANNLVVSSCYHGIIVTNSSSGIQSGSGYLITTGNAQRGIWAAGGNFTSASVNQQLVTSGNGDAGVLSDSGGTVSLGALTGSGTIFYSQYNKYGVASSYGAWFRFLAISTIREIVSSNLTYDVIASSGGKALLQSNATSSGTYLPSNNTNDVTGAWLSVGT